MKLLAYWRTMGVAPISSCSVSQWMCLGVLLSFAVTLPRAGMDSQTIPRPDEEIPSLVAGRDFYTSDPQLSELIAILLEEHPRIQSARAMWRARLERVPQARSFADPQVSYRYFVQTPETRVGPQEQMLEFSQGIPWFGKRELQAQRARHLASTVAWRVRDLERTLVAELKRAYFEAAYLQEALAVNSDEMALLQRFEKIALTRYSTGEGIQQSVVKVQTDINRLVDQETSLRQRLDAVVRRIAQLTGRPDSALQLRPVRLKILDLRYDRSELESESVVVHPQVRAVRQQIEGDRAWYRRRLRDSRPDFRFSIGYTSVDEREDTPGILTPPVDNGKDILGATLGLNLPVYRRRIRAGIAEADQSIRSSEQLLRDVRDRLRFQVQESILRLESLDERARLYKEVIIPQAEESLASAEAAYVTNRQDFLDLLDAERVLFQVRLTYHRLLADYWIALADLELAVGKRFPGGPVDER